MRVSEEQISRKATRYADEKYKTTTTATAAATTITTTTKDTRREKKQIYKVFTYPLRYSMNLTPLNDGMVRVRYISFS